MTPSSTFFRLLRYFLVHRWRIFGGLLAVAIMSLADAASAFLIARLFDVLQTIGTQIRAGQQILVEIPFKLFDHVLEE